MNKSNAVTPTYFEQADITAFIYHVLKLPP